MSATAKPQLPATAEPASGLALGAWGRAISATGAAALRPASSSSSSYPTPAEASGWTRTSTAAETIAYAEALAAGSLPHAERLVLSQYGTSEEGRPLTLVTVSDPPIARSSISDLKASTKLRVHVNANIHAGEVEGKECVQQLLREFAMGDHAELLEHAIVVCSICCNPDGNEMFSIDNRVDQHGPDGVGVRPNGKGLDLNRDFIKTEAAEVRGLIRVFQEFDPAVFVDLHATDGSHHGYHVTYATSLSPNVDPALAEFTRSAFLPDIKSRCLAEHAVRAFHYGNFRGGDPDRGEASDADETREWVTYDHRPRFGTNYNGLRNRISVLSEVYSHLDFEERTRVSRALVLETLTAAVAHRAEIATLTAAADESGLSRSSGVMTYGADCELGPSSIQDVLVGSCTAVEVPQGTVLVADEEYEAVPMKVFSHFVATTSIDIPRHGWAVLPAACNDMERLLFSLKMHGVKHELLTEPAAVESAAKFDVKEVSVIESPTAHGMSPDGIQLDGAWDSASGLRLPVGSVVVSGEDRLVRLAAQLLEPKSTDSLFTYEVLGTEDGECPVWQLLSAPNATTSSSKL